MILLQLYTDLSIAQSETYLHRDSSSTEVQTWSEIYIDEVISLYQNIAAEILVGNLKLIAI